MHQTSDYDGLSNIAQSYRLTPLQPFSLRRFPPALRRFCHRLPMRAEPTSEGAVVHSYAPLAPDVSMYGQRVLRT